MNEKDAKKQIEVLIEQATKKLSPFAPAESPLIVYGAGNCGRDVATTLKRKGYHISGFIDQRGSSLTGSLGVDCVRPDSEQAKKWALNGWPVVIATFNYAADIGEIADRLEEIGYTRVVSYYEVFEMYPEDFPSRFWLAPRGFYADHKKELLACLALWGDDASRAVFLELLELRLTFNIKLLRNPDWQHQYFPKDIPRHKEPIRLVDGGAFVGDTLKGFIQNGFAIEAVAAFEPDPENFKRLRCFTTDNKALLGDHYVLPCGLGRITGIQSFTCGNGEGSLLSQDGSSVIQVVALDDVMPVFSPTLIKLDVEGVELEALWGARNTIVNKKPTLAISAYHAPAHLWQIPLLLNQWVPDYKFALRYHQYNDFDVVVYAFKT